MAGKDTTERMLIAVSFMVRVNEWKFEGEKIGGWPFKRKRQTG